MTEVKVLDFENSITSDIYLDFANNNKLYYQMSRNLYNLMLITDTSSFDREFYSEQRIKECIYRDLLKSWYEERQEQNLSLYRKEEIRQLVSYAMSMINWDEITASLIRDIEKP